MPLDLNTLLVVTVANIAALALVSPAVMGRHLSEGARAARWSLIVHAASWVCMISSNLWPETLADRILSTLAVGGFAGANWLLYKALGHWLGPRPAPRLTAGLVLLIPCGYFLLFGSYAWRVGWSNLLLAAQLFLVALACFAPATAMRGKWRLVVACGMVLMGVLTLGRGFLGAWTDLYPSFLTPHPWNVAAMLMTNLLPLVANYAILGGWHEEAENALHRLAITDTQTGLYNRRGWTEIAGSLVANANRQQLPVALLMFDIDHFKQINDSHGHEAGDRALQAFGGLILASRRAGDLAARIGGEEFCLLLPGCQLESGQGIDLRLRQELAPIAAELGFRLDYSGGLAVLEPGETLEQLMRRADRALYTAKENGRGHLQAA